MTILHGKIPYEPVWNLEVVLRPEFVIDYTDRWPADQYKKYVNCELECYYENLEIAVMYDQTCLLQEKILNTHAVTLDQNLKDDKQNDHELIISLSGADIHNNFLVDGRILTLGVGIKILVEGIDLEWYLNNHKCFLTESHVYKCGTTFMSENGQQKINLQTPIYPWLMKNETQIITQISKTTSE
jgi:hypothetical protein